MQLSITEKTLLTPESNDKDIYYLTLSIPENSQNFLDYQPGDWLTVKASNQVELVDEILKNLSLNGSEAIELRRHGKVSTHEALLHYLEITQLNPAILNKLQRQFQIGDWPDRQAMMDYAFGRDILDLLNAFPELCDLKLDFLALLSPLAPRYYSIASNNEDGKSVSILYRQVHYEREARIRHGVTTNHLTKIKLGECLDVEIKHNPTFKMPASVETPIIMIGAGTGLAPFLGFMQAREQQRKHGGGLTGLGDSKLFFGESTEKHHCLCCEQLLAWQSQGLVQLITAFSRDQAHKIYIQQRLLEQGESVFKLLQSGAHLYICGSQTRLAVGVKAALLEVFETYGAMTSEQAKSYWEQLRKDKRLQQDIY